MRKRQVKTGALALTLQCCVPVIEEDRITQDSKGVNVTHFTRTGAASRGNMACKRQRAASSPRSAANLRPHNCQVSLPVDVLQELIKLVAGGVECL